VSVSCTSMQFGLAQKQLTSHVSNILQGLSRQGNIFIPYSQERNGT